METKLRQQKPEARNRTQRGSHLTLRLTARSGIDASWLKPLSQNFGNFSNFAKLTVHPSVRVGALASVARTQRLTIGDFDVDLQDPVADGGGILLPVPVPCYADAGARNRRVAARSG